MEDSAILTYVLGLMGQIKLFHWSTMSYIQHQALDKLHDALSGNVDMLIEVYLGRYRKQPVKPMKIKLECTTDTTDMMTYLESQQEAMKQMLVSFEDAPQIQNIIEEMMASIDQCLYLCRLQECKCKL